MCLEVDVGWLGEDIQDHLSELDPVPVAWEMLQSRQTVTQVTTNIFQSAVEFLVLL